MNAKCIATVKQMETTETASSLRWNSEINTYVCDSISFTSRVVEFLTDNKCCTINKGALIVLLGHLYGTVKFTFQPLARFNSREGSPHRHTVQQRCYSWDTPGMISTYQWCQQITLPMKAQRSKLLVEQKTNLLPIQSFSLSMPGFHSRILNLSSPILLSTVFI